MNTILLQPTDVLFFRDGRPMIGSLAGHTAAWPLPNVTSAALHAALHRAGLNAAHVHRQARSGLVLSEDREKHGRKFGSMTTAGPFPVMAENQTGARWFFSRPLDAQKEKSVAVSLFPAASLPGRENLWKNSSLPAPLKYGVANAEAPDKNNKPENWMSRHAMEHYLKADENDLPPQHLVHDSRIADQEQQTGITVDPETETAGQGEAKGKIYTAHYLRLRPSWRLGVLATAPDKGANADLIGEALRSDGHIVIGGQQRVCTAQLLPNGSARLPLPIGMRTGFENKGGKWLVKWVLLSPAIWPEISAKKTDGSDINPHPGGWLPNWIFLGWDPGSRKPLEDERNGKVLLTSGPGKLKSARTHSKSGGVIHARLVAAIVPKPLVVTGWSLGDERLGNDGKFGAKSSHLAVPAGAVYYFEAETENEATALADTLNWHGAGAGAEIKHRRSSLMGEKGFGLGVCGTWKFFEDVSGHSKT